MAGLTKEQRAAREAERAQDNDTQEYPAAASDGLVRVHKAGEVLEVHPSCLAAHIALGWSQD